MWKRRILTICLLAVVTATSLLAVEVKTEQSTGKDGESITTIYYQGEPDGLAKKVLYGNSPKYRLMETFYEPNNKKFLDHAEYHDFEVGLPCFPAGKSINSTIYYQKNDPDYRIKLTTRSESGFVVAEYSYRNGSPEGITLDRISTYPNGQPFFQENFFSQVSQNTKQLKEYRRTFNDNKEVQFVQIKYYSNADFLVMTRLEYRPPEFSERDDKPWKVERTYENHPDGLLRIESEFLSGNRSSDNLFFDYKKNSKGYNKLTNLFLNKKLIKQVQIYEQPKDGKSYLCISDYNADGTVSTKSYDLAGNEVK